MKVAIAMVQVPFIRGGAEILAEMLCNELKIRGHEADIITVPFKWYPTQRIIDSMIMGRLIDLSEVNGEKIDIVIAMKFPAYYVKHDCKVLWLMHQHRQAYDLWGTPYGDIHNSKDGLLTKNAIKKYDTKYILEAKKIFTISQNTSKRLLKNNGIDSVPLYHPPQNYNEIFCEGYGDFIFYPSRIDEIKRQRLLVEAARYVETDVTFILAGSGSKKEIEYINRYIEKYELSDKVTMAGYISEEEKIKFYALCLGVYFGAYDEDYGYITLESFFAKKPIIVHDDAGGPLEFVEQDVSGFIVSDDAKKIAEKIDIWYLNKKLTQQMGEAGYKSLLEKQLNWDYIIEQLLHAVKEN